MSLRRIVVTTIALLLVIAPFFSAMAQTSKGIIAGIVRDTTGAVVSGAKITVTSRRPARLALRLLMNAELIVWTR